MYHIHEMKSTIRLFVISNCFLYNVSVNFLHFGSRVRKLNILRSWHVSPTIPPRITLFTFSFLAYIGGDLPNLALPINKCKLLFGNQSNNRL